MATAAFGPELGFVAGVLWTGLGDEVGLDRGAVDKRFTLQPEARVETATKIDIQANELLADCQLLPRTEFRCEKTFEVLRLLPYS
jgi:hypothetical protein